MLERLHVLFLCDHWDAKLRWSTLDSSSLLHLLSILDGIPQSEFHSRFISPAVGKRLTFVTDIRLEGSIHQHPYKVLELLIEYSFVSDQLNTKSSSHLALWLGLVPYYYLQVPLKSNVSAMGNFGLILEVSQYHHLAIASKVRWKLEHLCHLLLNGTQDHIFHCTSSLFRA